MDERFLIDTSAYGRYLTQRLSDDSRLFMRRVLTHQSIMSVVTRMELLSWTPGDKQLETAVKEIIGDSVIIQLSEEIILQTVRLRRHYKSVKLPDAIIAATAIVNEFTLLSTNDSDFEKISGLKYISLNQ